MKGEYAMGYQIHPWKIMEHKLDRGSMRFWESLTSTGNGYMGMRGNFEEDYSGDTHLGTYIGGVWFPDKTRVGWWKNGYPQYFGKAINCVRMNGIHVEINDQPLDLATADVVDFYRELDMQTGVFLRRFTVWTAEGKVTVEAERFVSLAQKELLAISYSVTPENDAKVVMRPYLDANVKNLDSNYDETFWEMLQEEWIMLNNLNVTNCFYMDTTALNKYTIQGVLPQVKPAMLEGIRQLLEREHP